MKPQGIDFNKELKQLKSEGPKCLYLLYGPEDYLRDRFVSEIRSLCTEDTAFGFYSFDDFPDVGTLSSSVDTMPFLNPRTLIEIKNCSVNKMSEDILDILKNLPDYCTVLLICAVDYSLDSRTKVIKYLQGNAACLNFTLQEDAKLYNWIKRRFEAHNKSITQNAVQRLIFISGNQMSGLIPEIEKIANSTDKQEISVDDVNKLANHIPEAQAFDLVNLISEKKNNEAIHMLADLLNQKSTESVVVLSALAYQFRQLYGAKIGDLSDKFDYKSKILNQSASKFTKQQLIKCINICADYEYYMKTSLISDIDILKDTVVRIISEVR